MKKLFTLVTIILAMVVSSCTYDDTAVWNKLENHESRISALEELCREMNTNISALQSLVDAMQGGDYITSIVPVTKDGNTIGYTITFAENEPITIYHGTNGKDGANGADGKDGYTPVIGVKQDSDGIYYWTLNGEWLLDDSGNKIKAVGTNGNDGANGTDGKDGVDGITPQLKIEEGYWYVSYDNGTSWTQLGKATGEDGQDGANGADGVNGYAFFANVTVGEESVSFTLADGTEFVVPLVADSLLALLGDISYIPKYTDGKATVTRNADGIILAEFDFSVTPKSMATTIAENYETLLAINAIETVTRAVTLIRMPIVACEADEKSGTISIQASGEFLNPGAFTGDITYSAALTISDGVNSVISDYIELCTYVSTEDSNDEKPEDNTPEDKTQPIKFNDNTVKTLCVVSWDTNGDAELSYEEAAAVTDIGTTFESYDIISFTELAFFTGLSYIANEAFLCCGSLKKIELPHNIISIGDSAFSGCNELTSVTIPDSVTSIGKYAFSGCNELTSVTIGNSVTTIGREAFSDCSSLTSVTISNSVTTIGNSAFRGCTSLTSVIIPDSVTSIGKEAFRDCSSLTSVTIPDSVTSIGDYTFLGCDSLTSVTIGNGVTSIGKQVFSYCDSLRSVTIPDSVTSIREYAFYDCYSLTSVYCKAVTPPAGGSDMFKSNASGRKIYVPAASVEAYKSKAYWKDYASDIVGYEF